MFCRVLLGNHGEDLAVGRFLCGVASAVQCLEQVNAVLITRQHHKFQNHPLPEEAHYGSMNPDIVMYLDLAMDPPEGPGSAAFGLKALFKPSDAGFEVRNNQSVTDEW